jgi:hypothetical protein
MGGIFSFIRAMGMGVRMPATTSSPYSSQFGELVGWWVGWEGGWGIGWVGERSEWRAQLSSSSSSRAEHESKQQAATRTPNTTQPAPGPDLCVDEELAVQLVGAIGGVAREQHAWWRGEGGAVQWFGRV